MAFTLIEKVDGYGKRTYGNVDVSNIDWITGSYTYIPNLTSVGGNSFDIAYTAGGDLYDQYSPVIDGGSLAVSVPTTETYVCPTKAGAITWSDVNPAGGGIGNLYGVDGLMPAHLCRARSKTMNAYVYTSIDGYCHEVFLLFAHSSDDGFGIERHYFFWAYPDISTGLWTRVPSPYTNLPQVGETFDMWIPTSVNVSNAKWSSWLVQDTDKLQTGSGGSGSVGDFPKIEDTIASANEADGTTYFSLINISTIQGTTVLGFLNGVEVNVEIGNPATATSSVDIVVDNTSPSYPTSTRVFWHGSNYVLNASLLGDCDVGDVIRLYYLTS